MEYAWIIVVPYLIILLAVVALTAACFKKWYVSGIGLLLCAVLNYCTESIPLNIFPVSNDGHSLRVMTFNIDGSSVETAAHAQGLVDVILKENADVVCLEEWDTKRCESVKKLLMSSYPHFAYKSNLWGAQSNAIFSKYELENVHSVWVDTTTVSGDKLLDAKRIDKDLCLYLERMIISADVIVGKKPLRVVACHFASNRFSSDGYSLDRLEAGGIQREVEAEHVRAIVDSCIQMKVPVVVCGDMNDFSGSKPLRILQKDGVLHDAWWKRGLGLGSTYHGHGWMHFRLDHILKTDDLRLIDIRVVNQKYSDHDALVAEFEIK